MSFLVRQIALKSSGEQIVRPNTVERDEVFIGRDASCEVHVPDLAINPRHARVRRLGEDRLLIESLGDQPFEVNGRTLTSYEANLASGEELGFGAHRITVSRDDETGLPTLSVMRVEAVSEADATDVNKVYTLEGLMPGKRVSAWTFGLLILLAFLVAPVWSYLSYKPIALQKDGRRPAGFHADKTWNSGKISAAHAKFADDCQACHTDSFVAVQDNSCQTCHKQDATPHIADKPNRPAIKWLAMARGEPTGFAGFQRAVAVAFNRPVGRCVECHTEHVGAGPMPATKQQFCADCHEGMKERLRGVEVGNAADFGVNHPQFRPLVIVDPTQEKPVLQRVEWSPALRENDGLRFTHAQHMSKTNAVAQMVIRRAEEYRGAPGLDCKDCHKVDAKGERYDKVEMEKACETCHSLTFDQVGGTFRSLSHGKPQQVAGEIRAMFGAPLPRPAGLSPLDRRIPGTLAAQVTARDFARAVRFYPTRAGQAVSQVFSKGGQCYDCHIVTKTGTALSNGFDVQRVAQHNRYYHQGWFDHKDHTKTDCVFCHTKAETSNDAADLLVPGQDGQGGCRSCHVGETGKVMASVQVLEKNKVNSSCAMCHSYHVKDGAPWKPKQLPAKGLQRADADRPRLPVGIVVH